MSITLEPDARRTRSQHDSSIHDLLRPPRRLLSLSQLPNYVEQRMVHSSAIVGAGDSVLPNLIRERFTPQIQVCDRGFITLLFDNQFYVEVTVNRNYRICIPNAVGLSMTSQGAALGVDHPRVKYRQDLSMARLKFPNNTSGDVLGWMNGSFVWLWKPTTRDESCESINVDDRQGLMRVKQSFGAASPLVSADPSLSVFYSNSTCGSNVIAQCHDLVARTHVLYENDASLTYVNDLVIKVRASDMEISVFDQNLCRATVNPHTLSVLAMTPHGKLEIRNDGGVRAELYNNTNVGKSVELTQVHGDDRITVTTRRQGPHTFDLQLKEMDDGREKSREKHVDSM